jgi:mRNA interferase ChpB
MILSPEAFNKRGLAVVCPISGGGSNPRTEGFAVSLIGTGMRTDGVVLCNQLRSIDLKERGARRIEKSAPDYVVHEVLARVAAIFE